MSAVLWEFTRYTSDFKWKNQGRLHEREVELDLYRWHLGWQGRRGTLGEDHVAKTQWWEDVCLHREQRLACFDWSTGNNMRCNERGSKRAFFKVVEHLVCRFYSVGTRELGKVSEKC